MFNWIVVSIQKNDLNTERQATVMTQEGKRTNKKKTNNHNNTERTQTQKEKTPHTTRKTYTGEEHKSRKSYCTSKLGQINYTRNIVLMHANAMHASSILYLIANNYPQPI